MTYKRGGQFSGPAHGVFLYPYMQPREDVPWTFPVPVPVAEDFDGRHFMLLEPVHYMPYGHIVSHSAHAGLTSDGGTIRTALGWTTLSTPFRDYLPAFLIHDALCETARMIADDGDLVQASRLRLHADNLFRVMILDIAMQFYVHRQEMAGEPIDYDRVPGRWDAWVGFHAVRVGASLSGLVLTD